MREGSIRYKGLAAIAVLALSASTLLAQAAFSEPAGVVTVQQSERYYLAKDPLMSLNLTVDQAIKVKEINKNAAAQENAVRADTTLTPVARAQRLKAIRANRIDAINQVLTPEQQRKWAELRRERAKSELVQLSERLGLTKDQRAQVKLIIENQRAEVRSVQQNPSLTPDVRKAQVRQIRENGMARIRQLLTPEQIRKLDAMRAERMRRN